MNNLFLEAIKTFGNLKTCATKGNGLVEDYIKEDDLGQKTSEVLSILLQRLNKRITKYCS
uniref:Inositol monophosphatase n=1 Tax=Schistosoma mansoni TaxID=6183 RepID=A0A5K4F7L9_SCHMA